VRSSSSPVVRLMPVVRAEPSGRWQRRRSQRRVLFPMRLSDGRRRGGLPFFLLKVADLGFLLHEDEDQSEAGPS
jgi:hypothetical protein